MSLLGPIHIISYGTLLGVQVHQTFIQGPVAFKTIPRLEFAKLQGALFPIYFTLQSALPVITALTYPGVAGGPSSISGALLEENRLTTLLPLSLTLVSALVNLFYITPQTAKVKEQRWYQETIDGKKSYDPAPHSQQMVALNKKFGKLHGLSTLVNLGALISTVTYGVVLGHRLF